MYFQINCVLSRGITENMNKNVYNVFFYNDKKLKLK